MTSFKRQLTTSGISEVFSIFAGMLFSILSTRAMQPAEKGIYASTLSIVLIANSIGSLGIGKTLVVFISRESDELNDLLSAATSLLLIPVVIFSLFLLLQLLNGQEVSIVMSSLLLFTMLLAGGLTDASCRGLGKIELSNLSSILQNLLYIGLATLAYVYGFQTAATFLFIVSLGWLLRTSVVLYYVPRLRESFHFKKPSLAKVRRILSYGFAYTFSSFIWILHTRLDVLLMGYLTNSAQTGIYSTGANLAQMLWKLPVVVTSVLIPYLAKETSSNVAIQRTAKVSRILLPVIAVACMTAFLLSDFAVKLLYGPSFIQSSTPLKILLPGVGCSIFYLVHSSYLVARDNLKPLIRAGFLSLLINLLLNLLLIPLFGMDGAALSSSVSYTLLAFYILLVIRREGGLSFRDLLCIRRSDFS